MAKNSPLFTVVASLRHNSLPIYTRQSRATPCSVTSRLCDVLHLSKALSCILMSAAYFTHLDGGHDGFKRISEYKMQTCSFVSKSVPLVGGARRWQAIQQSCVKSLETCRRSVWMRADVHDGSHAVTSGQACGSISLDRSPQVLKGNKTTHKYSGRKTSRRPRQVSYDTSGSVKISSPSLLDRQKILAKKIKSHGQRGDWCGALKVLR